MEEIQNSINPDLMEYIKNKIPLLSDDQTPGLLINFYEIHELINEFYKKQIDDRIQLPDVNDGKPVIEYNEEAVSLIYEELCLGSDLYWNNYEAIAYCLNHHFPNTDLIDISDEEIIDKVRNLQNFLEKDIEPPEDIATAIITIWVEIYYN